MNIIFKIHYMLIVKYIYNFRGTCASIQMLQGCMVRETLETPGLDSRKTPISITNAEQFFSDIMIKVLKTS